MPVAVYTREGRLKNFGKPWNDRQASAAFGSSVASGSNAAHITWNTTFHNTDSSAIYLPATNQIGVRDAGLYDIEFHILSASGQADGRGDAYVEIYSSGGVLLRSLTSMSRTIGGYWHHVISQEVYLQAGGHLRARVDGGSYAGSDWVFCSVTKTAVSVGVAPEPWRYVGRAGEPAFQNNWVNYHSNNIDRVARFRKMPDGTVVLGGLIQNGTMGLATPAFTLPVGYRPFNAGADANTHFPVVANGAFGYVVVNGLNGNVSVVGGTNPWVDLSSISYPADA